MKDLSILMLPDISTNENKCIFCQGDHEGSWCMAITDEIAYFKHTETLRDLSC